MSNINGSINYLIQFRYSLGDVIPCGTRIVSYLHGEMPSPSHFLFRLKQNSQLFRIRTTVPMLERDWGRSSATDFYYCYTTIDLRTKNSVLQTALVSLGR